jgi:hypothetical protein
VYRVSRLKAGLHCSNGFPRSSMGRSVRFTSFGDHSIWRSLDSTGRERPGVHPGADPVQAEAYSHEVISGVSGRAMADMAERVLRLRGARTASGSPPVFVSDIRITLRILRALGHPTTLRRPDSRRLGGLPVSNVRTLSGVIRRERAEKR